MRDREELISEIKDDAKPLPQIGLPCNAISFLSKVETANESAGGRAMTVFLNQYRLAELRSIMVHIDQVFTECSLKTQVVSIEDIYI